MIEWKTQESDRAPAVTYVIATNPRTGSWLLADSLNQTGIAGKPGEWFSRMEETRIRRALPDMDYEAYVKFVCSQSCTLNGVSAIKMHRHDFDVLSGKSDQPVHEILAGAKFIWLIRHDTARQAVSYVIARQTHEWWRVRGDAPKRRALEYDERAIELAEEELIYLDSCWEGWFARTGIEPLMLSYEDDLLGGYQKTTRRVLDWLDVGRKYVPDARLVRQADERNEEWWKRYVSARLRSSRAGLRLHGLPDDAGEGTARRAGAAPPEDSRARLRGDADAPQGAAPRARDRPAHGPLPVPAVRAQALLLHLPALL
jgi:trehalose 2-sulfotransferase